MTELILIRHGETDWNRELRFQGHVDVPLNATGIEQARRLGERLAGEKIDHFYVSDLMRTRQTAEPAQRLLSMTPVHDNAWREQHFGQIEGMRVDDVKASHPEAWEGWTRFQQDFAMPGGESARQFHARIMGAVERLAALHAGKTLLVVTHGGALDMIFRTAKALGLDGPRQSLIPNAGVSRVRYDAGRFDILDWADTRHLDGMPAQPLYDQRKHAAGTATSTAEAASQASIIATSGKPRAE